MEIRSPAVKSMSISRGWERVKLPRELDQIVGRVPHRRDHHHQVRAAPPGAHDPFGHVLDALGEPTDVPPYF